jgi:hypothetical protein
MQPAQIGPAIALGSLHLALRKKAGGGAYSVTTKKPDGTKEMMIGTGYYKAKADAEAAMKAAAECAKKK